MANWCDNRMEISFANSEAEAAWKAKYLSEEHGKTWLDTTVGANESAVMGDSTASQSFAKVVDEEVGDGGSFVLYIESRWAPPSWWFSEMVKADASISSASLEYSEPNMCFVGSIEWEKSTNTLTETYRSLSDLTDDDWFILGHDRCQECSEFLCEC